MIHKILMKTNFSYFTITQIDPFFAEFSISQMYRATVAALWSNGFIFIIEEAMNFIDLLKSYVWNWKLKLSELPKFTLLS